MKKITISVGIPVYNEGKSIRQLLSSILSQKDSRFTLQKIIVANDGSTDNTVDMIKKIKDKRILLLQDKQRKGKTARLNQMFRLIESEAVLVMDADIFIKDKNLFSEIIRQSNLKKDGIVAVNIMPLPGKNFFENVINYSVLMLQDIKKNWNGGENYLSFKGALLLLDGQLARSITMPDKLVNDDAFLYLSAIKEKFHTKYLPGVSVWYRSPASFSDHLKQSKRFQSSYDELKTYFTNIRDEYSIPKSVLMRSVIKYAMINPYYFVSYVAITIAVKMHYKNVRVATWSVAHSTKQ